MLTILSREARVQFTNLLSMSYVILGKSFEGQPFPHSQYMVRINIFKTTCSRAIVLEATHMLPILEIKDEVERISGACKRIAEL